MKRLLVLRHAKSSWKNPELADHDRPLNKRGKRDAPRIGRLLRQEGLVPDLIVSSTAARARKTAKHVAAECGSAGGVELTRRLYMSGAREYLRVLGEVGGDHRSVMVVGHNPDVEELVRVLTGADETMPTAALALIELPLDSWRELAPGSRGRLMELWRPKELPAE
jgi:phosphohistidine phosphatase